MKPTPVKFVIVALLWSLCLSGCAHLPPFSIQDKRFDPNAPIYHSRDPNKKPGASRPLSETELNGKR
jgi:hypothetical protein